MASINRPTKPCTNSACGNTLYTKALEYVERDGVRKLEYVFQCTNCWHFEVIKHHPRRTNKRRALDFHSVLKAAWKQTDEDLRLLCAPETPNRIPTGCLLVHSSTFNHHMENLIGIGSKEKLSTFEVRYHNREAGYALQNAKTFVVKAKLKLGWQLSTPEEIAIQQKLIEETT